MWQTPPAGVGNLQMAPRGGLDLSPQGVGQQVSRRGERRMKCIRIMCTPARVFYTLRLKLFVDHIN